MAKKYGSNFKFGRRTSLAIDRDADGYIIHNDGSHEPVDLPNELRSAIREYGEEMKAVGAEEKLSEIRNVFGIR